MIIYNVKKSNFFHLLICSRICFAEFFEETEHCVNVLKFACFGGHCVILCYCLGIFNEVVKNKTALDEFIQSEGLLEICLHC